MAKQMVIAVCDDDINFLMQVKNKLSGILEKHDTLILFDSGKALISKIGAAECPFDLIFLDIEMPIFNGFDTAHQIRAYYPKVPIILLTNYEKYSLEGYSIQPRDYIMKPPQGDILKHHIDNLRVEVQNRDYIYYQHNSKRTIIPLNDIRYIESFGWRVVLHYGSLDYAMEGRIGQLYNKLGAKDFVRVHRSYLVNMNHVQSIEYDKLSLFSGEVIPIARNNYKLTLDAFMEKRKRDL